MANHIDGVLPASTGKCKIVYFFPNREVVDTGLQVKPTSAKMLVCFQARHISACYRPLVVLAIDDRSDAVFLDLAR